MEDKFSIDNLMNALQDALGMMEPYYSQCGAGDEYYELIYEWKASKPVKAFRITPAECKLCGKQFIRSRKKNALDVHQRNLCLTNHLMSEHGLVEYADRKPHKIKSKMQTIVFKNHRDFLDNAGKGWQIVGN